MDASYYVKLSDGRVVCHLCPHECELAPNVRGRCRVRKNMNGELRALGYGKATAIDIDPMEKKPLYHFLPGRPVMSFGSWGCNLHCEFCQNFLISQQEHPARTLEPADVARLTRDNRCPAAAFTYNEPLVGFEFVRDAARAVRAAGAKTVLVTNGYINPEPWDEMLDGIDAANIDIKSFEDDFYRRHCSGTLSPVLASVAAAAKRGIHVELTTLVIPTLNDFPKPMEDLARWIADHCGAETPMHLSAYFPRYRSTVAATPPVLIERMRDIFGQHLRYVYAGNVTTPGGADTVCAGCGTVAVRRSGFTPDLSGLGPDGRCARCGHDNGFVMS